MASPHVCGAVALVLQDDPSLSAAAVQRRLQAQASRGVVTDARSEKNYLLYSGSDLNPTMSPTTSPAPTTSAMPSPAPTEWRALDLEDGVPSEPLTLTFQNEKFYRLTGADDEVTCTLNGDNGDADLYVSAGNVPSRGYYDCSSTSAGSIESCTVNQSGEENDIFVLAYAYSSFTDVVVTCSVGTLCPCQFWQIFCRLVNDCLF